MDLQISSSDGYRFLARPEEGGTLKYVQLSSVLSGLSTMISAISSGGGGCSASISGNVEGSTGTGPQVQIFAGLSCRLSAWSELGRLSVGVYYL